MKILILGHGRHGKDTVAEMIADATTLKFCSSSEFVCERVVYPQLSDVFVSPMACYRWRHYNRQLWYDIICEYNKNDKSRLCKELLNEYDIYVGMRCDKEYQASKHLFDHVIYVDAFDRVDYKDTTMWIAFNAQEMLLLDNNSDVKRLRIRVNQLINTLLLEYKSG